MKQRITHRMRERHCWSARMDSRLQTRTGRRLVLLVIGAILTASAHADVVFNVNTVADLFGFAIDCPSGRSSSVVHASDA
jgi:hypothetical protein